MVKPVIKAELSTFTRGIITEASVLNFPPEASLDEENFKINKDGSRDRRLGLDFEANHARISTDATIDEFPTLGTSTFRWTGANQDPLNEFVVVQFGSKLKVFDATKASISGEGFLGTVSIPVIDKTKVFTYAAVDGILVIASGVEEVFSVSYNGSSFSVTTNRLLVRDLWGVPETGGNDLNKRPTSLTQDHLYNLRNQGWGIPRKNSAGTLTDPISIFNAEYGVFPAPSEAVVSALQFQAGTTPFERIYPSMYNEVLGLNAPPAKGYFIIDALRRGTSRLSAAQANKTKFPSLVHASVGLNSDTTTQGCSLVAEYSGRVFYAGFGGNIADPISTSPALSSYILFSQLVKSQEDIVKCYQEGDPTSRENSDVIDTDGGFIRISGAKKILGMVALTDRLVILADNGVWALRGGSDFGFSATNYSVSRVSTFGCINSRSIVIENDKIYYWGDSGIFLIFKDQFGDLKVESITEQTIQKLYNSIPTTSKENSRGIYDPFEKSVRWLYSFDQNRTNNNQAFELILDVVLGAFTKNRFYATASESPDIVGYIPTSAFLTGDTEDTVIVPGEGVTLTVVVNGEPVVVEGGSRSSGVRSIKYVCAYGSDEFGNIGFTFGTLRNEKFKDWFTFNGVGVDAKAYLLTGAATAGDSSVAKQSPYLVTHFLRTESGVENVGGELVPRNQSGCQVRVQWDFTNTINSNKWGPLFQAYRYRQPFFIDNASSTFDSGYQVITSKSKLRGRGKALSIYMETEPNKDCRLIGWSLSLTGNSLA